MTTPIDLSRLVPPLVWELMPDSDFVTYKARSAVGAHYIRVQPTGATAWRHSVIGDWQHLPAFDADNSISLSKAAAQADYAARIIAALDPDAVAKIREDALREAAKICGDRWAAHMECSARTCEMDYSGAKKDANIFSVAANEATFCADAILALIDKKDDAK